MNTFGKIFAAVLLLAYALAIGTPMAVAQEATQPGTAPSGESKSEKNIGIRIMARSFPGNWSGQIFRLLRKSIDDGKNEQLW
jgi:hypothetical protein